MKYKCEICGKEKETNDCVCELQINLTNIDKDDNLSDYVHSPIYSDKICSWCAEHIELICKRGMEKIKEDSKD